MTTSHRLTWTLAATAAFGLAAIPNAFALPVNGGHLKPLAEGGTQTVHLAKGQSGGRPSIAQPIPIIRTPPPPKPTPGSR
jgi:hypothetical protein